MVESFRTAALRCEQAGFDGVELHAANGYLFDQFLQDDSNRRTDSYGGSVENRARLLIDTTKAVISVWGSGKVAVARTGIPTIPSSNRARWQRKLGRVPGAVWRGRQ